MSRSSMSDHTPITEPTEPTDDLPEPRGDRGGSTDVDPSPTSTSTSTSTSTKGTVARLWSAIDLPVLCFVGVAIVLYTVVWFSTNHMLRNPSYPQAPVVFRGAGVLEGWARYDAGWYVLISAGGYQYTPGQMSSVAFFPAYPLSMRVLHPLTNDHVLAGIILTFFSGLGAVTLFYRWCCRHLSRPAARLAVVMLLVYPYAWYLYGAIYADAFFLVFALSAFLLVERDRPVLAGLAAAVATAARPVGIGVFIGLAAVELDRRRVVVIPLFDRVREVGWRAAWREWRAREPDETRGSAFARWLRLAPRRLRPADAGLALSLLGMASWCWFLATTYGNPFLFAEVESAPGWDQAQGPRTWFKIHWLGLLHHLPEYAANHVEMWDRLTYTLGITFQSVLVLVALLLVPLVIRRIGWPYALYILTVVGIPMLGSKDWQGTGRYLLAAFPLFAAVACWIVDGEAARHRRRLRSARIALVASAALLVFLTSAFARGYYLA